MLDIYKLQSQYLSLRERTRSLRSNAKAQGQLSISPGEAEGYELQEKSDTNSTTSGTITTTGNVVGISTAAGPPKYEVSADVAGLRKEWKVWQLASLKNVYVHSYPHPHILTIVFSHPVCLSHSLLFPFHHSTPRLKSRRWS